MTAPSSLRAAVGALAIAQFATLIAGNVMAADIDALWDYNQPAESEARFRAALKAETGDDALELETQIARTLSLRREFNQAHLILDSVDKRSTEKTRAAVRVRSLLERGRTWRSAGDIVKARPLFFEAWQIADREKLTLLAIDAAHMLGIVDPPSEAMRWNERAMALAMSSNTPRALRWRGSLANNMGHTERERGNLDAAQKHFHTALVAFGLTRSEQQIRIAQWQIANTLRLQKRFDVALAAQLKLEKDMLDANDPDAYVYEEIAEIYTALNQPEAAKPYFAKAAKMLAADAAFAENEKARLARLVEMAK